MRAIAREPWPDGTKISVRMAVYTGEAELRGGGNHGGLAIIRAARLRSLAHGGQILVSSTTATLGEDALPDGASLAELGSVALTPSEARVVELVSEGLPNKEIAAKLFVSLATVKTHLVHVYTKLDVRTRSELAAEAARRAVRA